MSEPRAIVKVETLTAVRGYLIALKATLDDEWELNDITELIEELRFRNLTMCPERKRSGTW